MRNPWTFCKTISINLTAIRPSQSHVRCSFKPLEDLKASWETQWWSDSLHGSAQTSSQKRENMKLLVQRFWIVVLPYWKSEDNVQALLRVFGILIVTFASAALNVHTSFLGRNFINALASKNKQLFIKQLVNYLAAIVVIVPVFVLKNYTRREFALQWRAWMSKYYLQLYLKNRAFYSIKLQPFIDNPDQRIVDDLESFAATTITFALSVVDALMDVISFSAILYSIYPPLFAVLIVYSVGGTAISIKLGKRLVQLNQMQEKWEADCRYGLMRIRENAESIAFYAGEFIEMNVLLGFFSQAFQNSMKRIMAETTLKIFKVPFGAIISLVPSAVVAPLYFAGKIEMGVITQSELAFQSVYRAFNIVVRDFEYLCSFSAVIHRLGEFFEALQEHSTAIPLSLKSGITDDEQTHILYDTEYSFHSDGNVPLLRVANLSVETPCRGLPLIRNLSFVVHKGDRMLITGISGCGKTSLLRAIAGLWHYGKGTIQRYFDYTDAKQIFFCPQKPYMVLGTLRQQLLYPVWNVDSVLIKSHKQDICCQPTDMELINILHKLNLESVTARYSLESTADWSSVLSLGEQQRIAFARILLCQPILVLLDEATSAVDEENEAFLYRQLQSAGISIISVGHRTSLRGLHTSQLRLHGDGTNWDMILL